MLAAYPACFFKESNAYSVVFPDLNSLATCASTLDEALAMAVDCLAGYLYCLEKDGDTPPAPSPLEQINLNQEAEGIPYIPEQSFKNIVTVDVAEYAKTHFEKSVRRTVTLPAWLNAAAIEKDININQVLQDALQNQLS